MKKLITFLLILSGLMFRAGQVQAVTVPLLWDAGAAPPPIQTYNIYRGLKADCSDCVQLNAAPITGLNYSDTTATAGFAYYYALTGVVGSIETKKGALMVKADLTVVPVMPTNFRIPIIVLP